MQIRHSFTFYLLLGTVDLSVSIMEGSGKFEICENGSVVVSGCVHVPDVPIMKLPTFDQPSKSSEEADLEHASTEDIYKHLRLRGYDYGRTFQGILETNNTGNTISIALD